MSDRSSKVLHVALVILYWFALLGLIGEQGNPKTANGTGVFLATVLVVFGIWRVVQKQRRRREAQAAVSTSDKTHAGT